MRIPKKRIYLDNAAATPVDSRVAKVMLPFSSAIFGNPSALYHSGRMAKSTLEKSRRKIASVLGCAPKEIIFTGSGTESDALALLGAMRGNAAVSGACSAKKKGHLVTTAIEHHAVLNNAKKLEQEGFEVTYVDVDRDGLVDAWDIAKAIKPHTILVSVMYANNEIGTIQPIKEIARAIRGRCRWKRRRAPFFHIDACQAAGYLDLNVAKLGVDLMTINGSKIYGPKGVGLLYVRRGVDIEPLWRGGGQENRLRSGTENIAGIAGLAEALVLAQRNRRKENERITALRDYLIKNLKKRIPKVVLNGHARRRLPNNVNVSILDIEGEALLLYLDRYGIEASTGSACDSASLNPSHVILAIGRPYEFAHASIRFSLGKSTTKKEIDYVLKVLPEIVEKLRRISPVRLKIGATQMSRAAAFVQQGMPHWERKREQKFTHK